MLVKPAGGVAEGLAVILKTEKLVFCSDGEH